MGESSIAYDRGRNWTKVRHSSETVKSGAKLVVDLARFNALGGFLFMTFASALEGGHGKIDEGNGGCMNVTVTRGEGVKKSENFADVI